jgi:two-component system sensor histidine kinase HydH
LPSPERLRYPEADDMNKGLHTDIHRRELTALLKASALINSSLQTNDVLDFAMKAAEEFMEAEASSVFELDPERGDISVRLARGEKGVFMRSKRLKPGEGIAGWVIQSGKPMMVEDVRRDPRFSDRFDRETGFATRSLICVPLTIRGRTIGALQVLNKRGGNSFSQEDAELLTALAQQIAVAVENAKLYQRLQQSFELTEQELKLTQRKLIRSERSAAIANLVQGVAHEVRNPIMSIGGFATRMKAEVAEDSRLHRYLDIVLSETYRLEKLVRDVKEIAAMQSVHLQATDMKNLLVEVIEGFSSTISRQAIRLETDIKRGLPAINLDQEQIARALRNIIQNSIEALHEGGTLKIEAKQLDSTIRIVVEDSGIGIEKDQLDSVLDPFVSSKTTGAGLGLTMVYQIVTNHRGEIDIKSNRGNGTTVTLELPMGLEPEMEE